MKRVLATGFAAVAAALALGYSQPAQAQTRCHWVGSQMQCQNDRQNNNYGYYNSDRNLNNNYHSDRGYYEEWQRQNHYNNSDNGYYEDWLRNNRYNGYYQDWQRNNQYYSNRVNTYNDANLRRSINEIYRQELGRNADWEGTQHYINQYQNGWSLGQIRNDIANSNEARYRYHRY